MLAAEISLTWAVFVPVKALYNFNFSSARLEIVAHSMFLISSTDIGILIYL